jgi:hypothetical protein
MYRTFRIPNQQNDVMTEKGVTNCRKGRNLSPGKGRKSHKIKDELYCHIPVRPGVLNIEQRRRAEGGGNRLFWNLLFSALKTDYSQL